MDDVGAVDNGEVVSALTRADEQLFLVHVQGQMLLSVEMAGCSATGTVGDETGVLGDKGNLGSSSNSGMTGPGVTVSSSGLSTDSSI